MAKREVTVGGIDPGYRETAIAIVTLERGKPVAYTGWGIRPPAKGTDIERAREVGAGLKAWLDNVAPSIPTHIGMESQFIAQEPGPDDLQYPRSRPPPPEDILKLGVLAGYIAGVLEEAFGVRIVAIPPGRAKSAVVGRATASKEQIQEALFRLYGIQTSTHHRADAASVAMAVPGVLQWGEKA